MEKGKDPGVNQIRAKEKGAGRQKGETVKEMNGSIKLKRRPLASFSTRATDTANGGTTVVTPMRTAKEEKGNLLFLSPRKIRKQRKK